MGSTFLATTRSTLKRRSRRIVQPSSWRRSHIAFNHAYRDCVGARGVLLVTTRFPPYEPELLAATALATLTALKSRLLTSRTSHPRTSWIRRGCSRCDASDGRRAKGAEPR